MKPVVIIMEGGIIESVYGSDVVIIDRDTEGMNEDELKGEAYIYKVRADLSQSELLCDIRHREPEVFAEVYELCGYKDDSELFG